MLLLLLPPPDNASSVKQENTTTAFNFPTYVEAVEESGKNFEIELPQYKKAAWLKDEEIGESREFIAGPISIGTKFKLLRIDDATLKFKAPNKKLTPETIKISDLQSSNPTTFEISSSTDGTKFIYSLALHNNNLQFKLIYADYQPRFYGGLIIDNYLKHNKASENSVFLPIGMPKLDTPKVLSYLFNKAQPGNDKGYQHMEDFDSSKFADKNSLDCFFSSDDWGSPVYTTIDNLEQECTSLDYGKVYAKAFDIVGNADLQLLFLHQELISDGRGRVAPRSLHIVCNKSDSQQLLSELSTAIEVKNDYDQFEGDGYRFRDTVLGIVHKYTQA